MILRTPPRMTPQKRTLLLLLPLMPLMTLMPPMPPMPPMPLMTPLLLPLLLIPLLLLLPSPLAMIAGTRMTTMTVTTPIRLRSLIQMLAVLPGSPFVVYMDADISCGRCKGVIGNGIVPPGLSPCPIGCGGTGPSYNQWAWDLAKASGNAQPATPVNNTDHWFTLCFDALLVTSCACSPDGAITSKGFYLSQSLPEDDQGVTGDNLKWCGWCMPWGGDNGLAKATMALCCPVTCINHFHPCCGRIRGLLYVKHQTQQTKIISYVPLGLSDMSKTLPHQWAFWLRSVHYATRVAALPQRCLFT